MFPRFERFQYDPVVVKNDVFRDQVIGLYMRRDEWCTALIADEDVARGGGSHTNHCNNYNEALMRALKDEVSSLSY